MKLPCVLVFVCTFALLPLLGCSAETNNGGSGGSAYLPRGGAWGGAVGSVSTIPAGSTAAASGGNGSVLITEAVQDPNQCGGNVYTAEAKSLDIYVMLDDSGSMFPWWPFTLDAVKQFVKAPESAGISMGFKFFGSDDVCDPQAYATPAVPIAPLPDNAANIEAALPFMPIESTPTQPALQGAITYARSWAQSHPESKVAVWLITDGIPSGCDSTVENVAQVAAEGLSGAVSIPTYVVGIGDLQALDAIAQAGGTEKATIIDVANMMASAQALLDAMNNLRNSALPCDYALPTANAGGTVDLDLVNLYFTPQGGQKTVVPRVPGADRCDPVNGGWYYNETSTRLLACDASCVTFKTTSGEVVVVLGCPTVVLK